MPSSSCIICEKLGSSTVVQTCILNGKSRREREGDEEGGGGGGGASFQASEGWFYCIKRSQGGRWELLRLQMMWAMSPKQLKRQFRSHPHMVTLMIKEWLFGRGCLLELSLIVLITYINATFIFPRCLFYDSSTLLTLILPL